MRRLPQILAVAALMMGAGTAQAFHSDAGCHSCHTPHNAAGTAAEVPLWSPAHHPDTDATTITDYYNMASASSSLDARVGAVDGASALCLACHDGTYGPVEAQHTCGDGADMGSLAGSHPISFVYDDALVAADTASNGGSTELVDPDTLAADILDGNNKLQCTSCHDIHTTATQEAGYLRWSYAASYMGSQAFCRNCHLK